jgi:hypothetical protein
MENSAEVRVLSIGRITLFFNRGYETYFETTWQGLDSPCEGLITFGIGILGLGEISVGRNGPGK